MHGVSRFPSHICITMDQGPGDSGSGTPMTHCLSGPPLPKLVWLLPYQIFQPVDCLPQGAYLLEVVAFKCEARSHSDIILSYKPVRSNQSKQIIGLDSVLTILHIFFSTLEKYEVTKAIHTSLKNPKIFGQKWKQLCLRGKFFSSNIVLKFH